MATRSFIGIYDGRNQSVEYIYCHNDGSLEWVGANLTNYYNDERTIRALLRKGSLSSLHPEIDTCTFLREYEPSMTIDNVKTIHEAFYQMYEESIEYMYLYDKDSRQWYYVSGVPSKSTKGKVLPEMESSENFDSLKDAVAYINGDLDRNGGYVDITKKRVYMQDDEGRYYDITTIEKDGRDVVISTEQGKTFKLADLKKPIQWNILNNLQYNKVERRGFRFQKRESVFKKSRKMERVGKPYEDPLYDFCKDLEKLMEKKGVLCEMWIEGIGIVRGYTDTGHSFTLYVTVDLGGSYPTQKVLVQQKDGSFKVGDIFEVSGDPDAFNVVQALDWILPEDVEEGVRKPCRKRRESFR